MLDKRVLSLILLVCMVMTEAEYYTCVVNAESEDCHFSASFPSFLQKSHPFDGDNDL